MRNSQIPGPKNLERKIPKSADLQAYKIKEYRGDALLRFLAIEIFHKKFAQTGFFNKNKNLPDEFLSNHLLIQIAEDVLHLTPHPELVEYYQKIEKEILERTGIVKKFKKPYADAFEHHLCEIYDAHGLKAAYDFVEKYLFSDYAIDRLKKRYPQIFTETCLKLATP